MIATRSYERGSDVEGEFMRSKGQHGTGRRRLAAVATCLMAATLLPGTAQATPAANSLGIKRSVTAQLNLSGWCDNTGSDINLAGEIEVDGGAALRVTMANNKKGTHVYSAETTETLVLIPADEDLSIPKQPAIGGVGGNPWFVLQFTDDEGAPLLTDEGEARTYVIGRCVQGWKQQWTERLSIGAGIDDLLTAMVCNNKGSSVELKGRRWQDGVNVNLVLANQVNKAPGQPGVHFADVAASASFELVPPVKVRKGWDKVTQMHGPGGNPLVFRKGIDGGEDPVYDRTDITTWGDYQGRCNKLMA